MPNCHRLKIYELRIPSSNGLMDDLIKYRSFKVFSLFSCDNIATFENVTFQEFQDFEEEDYVILGIEKDEKKSPSNFLCSYVGFNGTVELIRNRYISTYPEIASKIITSKITIKVPPFWKYEKNFKFKVGDYYQVKLSRASEKEIEDIKKPDDEWED